MFQIGDFIFHEYKLSQIKEIEGDKVVSVTDGYFQTSSNNLVVYPLNLRNKVISEEFVSWEEKLRESRQLNWPEIKHYLVTLWHKAILTENPEDLKEVFKEIRKFVEDVLQKAKEIISIQINGVSIFR